MNVTIQQIKCNSCESVIPQANTNGAIRLAGTVIDFCEACASKTVSVAAATFKMPPKPLVLMIKVGNGAPLPHQVPNAVAYLGTVTNGSSSFAEVQMADGTTQQVALPVGGVVVSPVAASAPAPTK